MLLTRSPLGLPQCCHWLDLARLACVKHAASVRPEPGSNSPLKSQTRSRRTGRRTIDQESHQRAAKPTADSHRVLTTRCLKLCETVTADRPPIRFHVGRGAVARWTTRRGDRPHWLFRPLFRFQGTQTSSNQTQFSWMWRLKPLASAPRTPVVLSDHRRSEAKGNATRLAPRRQPRTANYSATTRCT